MPASEFRSRLLDQTSIGAIYLSMIALLLARY